METKTELRSRIAEAIRALAPESRIVLDAAIATQISHLPAWVDAKRVFGYVAMDDEVDIQAILSATLRAGKELALPYWSEASDSMEFYPVRDLRSGISVGDGGAWVPSERRTPVEPDQTSVMLIPGRAFDRAGNRVGRGKGFFDRYLARETGQGPVAQTAATVGVAYSVQLLRSVPVGPTDRSVHAVVTDNETCFCSSSNS